MPIGAAIGGAVVGAGSQMYGANKAAGASKDALKNSMAQQQIVRDAANPTITAGNDALSRISDPNAFMRHFQASPDYNFRLDRGMDAVNTNRATSGLLRSGSALKGINQFGQGIAASEFGSWWNRQQGLVNTGLNAQGIAAGAANQNQQAIQTNGANQGGAAIANANAIGQFGGSIADIIGRYGTPTATVGGTSSYGA